MQARHKNPGVYFDEQARSCRDYYIPYITENSDMKFGDGAKADVLEIGCGFGGILSVFAETGCRVTGVDVDKRAIGLAREFFAERGLEGEFVGSDIFDYGGDRLYDLIILHDAIEHIRDKEKLMLLAGKLLKPGGVFYLGFPAWQMPFGGHQQMAKSKVLAVTPYTHLLPRPLFRALFKAFGESDSAVRDYFDMRETGLSIERFERLVQATGFRVVDRRLWFINPNYHVKFGLKPRILSPLIARIPRFRNYFTTTCYYLLSKRQESV